MGLVIVFFSTECLHWTGGRRLSPLQLLFSMRQTADEGDRTGDPCRAGGALEMQAKHPCWGACGGLRVQKFPSKGHGGPKGGSCGLSVMAAPSLHSYIPAKYDPLRRGGDKAKGVQEGEGGGNTGMQGNRKR